jgi:hypothetical protein
MQRVEEKHRLDENKETMPLLLKQVLGVGFVGNLVYTVGGTRTIDSGSLLLRFFFLFLLVLLITTWRGGGLRYYYPLSYLRLYVSGTQAST